MKMQLSKCAMEDPTAFTDPPRPNTAAVAAATYV